jgi:signal transduction histidine kinase
MAGFNILSILIFCRTLLWSKKGLLNQALLLGGLEVAAHQGFAVFTMGLNASFQNYVFILVVGTLFFSHISLFGRVVMAILPVLWYVAILVYGLYTAPLYELPSDNIKFFAILNSVLFIAMLMGMAIYFQYSVARARIHAEKMAASQTLFLANMSHELRTPLNAILGFSQILNRSKGLTSQERANLATINRSGEHLLTLINRILDMSKLEEGKLELKQVPFDLGQLLDEIYAMFSLAIRSKGLQLEVEKAPNLPTHLLGDELRLRQVLLNNHRLKPVGLRHGLKVRIRVG